MTPFRGILNDNGIESQFRIFIDLKKKGQYTTDFYIDGIRYDAKINANKCTIIIKKSKSYFDFDFFLGMFVDINRDEFEYEYVDYQITIQEINNELIIIGKEITEMMNMCYFPFICPKPRFFVATNKEQI